MFEFSVFVCRVAVCPSLRVAQVQQAVVSKRVESMAAAAEERRVRNAEMAAEVARAKAEAEAARAERATLEVSCVWELCVKKCEGTRPHA